jgi:hypothetical protein
MLIRVSLPAPPVAVPGGQVNRHGGRRAVIRRPVGIELQNRVDGTAINGVVACTTLKLLEQVGCVAARQRMSL